MKFTGLYLFKTRKVWNVIYWQCFLKAFENRNGKLLFFRSNHLKSSVKKSFLKISQISQENTCVRVYFNKFTCLRLATLSKETLTYVFSCEFSEIFKNTFFFFFVRRPPDNFFWILQMKIKLLKEKF